MPSLCTTQALNRLEWVQLCAGGASAPLHRVTVILKQTHPTACFTGAWVPLGPGTLPHVQAQVSHQQERENACDWLRQIRMCGEPAQGAERLKGQACPSTSGPAGGGSQCHPSQAECHLSHSRGCHPQQVQLWPQHSAEHLSQVNPAKQLKSPSLLAVSFLGGGRQGLITVFLTEARPKPSERDLLSVKTSSALHLVAFPELSSPFCTKVSTLGGLLGVYPGHGQNQVTGITSLKGKVL